MYYILYIIYIYIYILCVAHTQNKQLHPHHPQVYMTNEHILNLSERLLCHNVAVMQKNKNHHICNSSLFRRFVIYFSSYQCTPEFRVVWWN